MKRIQRILLTIGFGAMASCHGYAQTVGHAPGGSVVGTISAFKADTAEIQITPDGGAPVLYKVTGATITQQVAPGAHDLKQAQTIRITDVHLGDRVLATPEPGALRLQRLVVMNASEIQRRDAADRA